jgi:membrane protein DedA with SNARE-associated domain
MRKRSRRPDRLGAAMLLGALVGFVVGALAGLSSPDLSAPVLLPFAGAAAGVFAGAVIAATLGLRAGVERGRREASAREATHQRMRREAHRGWIDGIDLSADAPPAPPRQTRRGA